MVNTPAPVINNGVIVSLDEKSIWNVTGTCYLSSLSIAPGATIQGAALIVNGKAVEIAPGVYTGKIGLSSNESTVLRL